MCKNLIRIGLVLIVGMLILIAPTKVDAAAVRFKLDYNGGTHNTTGKNYEFVEDSDGLITIVDYSNKISCEGNILVGWFKSSDTTKIYKVGDKLTVKNGDVLFARWEREKIKFKLDYNGGQNNSNGKKEEVFYVNTNRIKLGDYSENISKEGYTLAGWRNAEGRRFSVEESVQVENDDVLHAEWKSESSGNPGFSQIIEKMINMIMRTIKGIINKIFPQIG